MPWKDEEKRSGASPAIRQGCVDEGRLSDQGKRPSFILNYNWINREGFAFAARPSFLLWSSPEFIFILRGIDHSPDMLVVATLKIGESECATIRVGLVIRQEHFINGLGLMFRCCNGAEAVFIIQVLIQSKRADKGNKQENANGANPFMNLRHAVSPCHQ